MLIYSSQQGDRLDDSRQERGKMRASPPSSKRNGITVESLSAELERNALARLREPLETSSVSPDGSDTRTSSQDQIPAMKAKLAPKLEALEKRTDEEIKRILRREYLRDATS